MKWIEEVYIRGVGGCGDGLVIINIKNNINNKIETI